MRHKRQVTGNYCTLWVRISGLWFSIGGETGLLSQTKEVLCLFFLVNCGGLCLFGDAFSGILSHFGLESTKFCWI